MVNIASSSFEEIRNDLGIKFAAGAHDVRRVDVGEWQSTDVRDRPEMVSYEMENVVLEWYGGLPQSITELQEVVPANQPWAEAHFLERVSGTPYNPPPSHTIWPHAQANNSEFTKDEKFSHTYPERFWPKMANIGGETDQGRQIFVPHVGIRFEYGDLDGVMDLLTRNPLTRQAYLPVWFPEDTGVSHGERVPCTLGYHFLIRDGKLTVTYFIRSCDFRRHFCDDVYLAARLAQWVAHDLSEQLEDREGLRVTPHRLIMHVVSLHVFQGDLELMRSEYLSKAPVMPGLQVSSSVAETARRIREYKW